jgi:hypothetical protein
MHDGKTLEWRNQAHEILEQVAKDNSIVVSDMVVSALEAAGLGLDNYSALGGVFTRGAKAGFIVKTDVQQQSTRGKSNSAKTVWRSMIYNNTGLTKEQNALGSLIMAALDFNAETIRLASLMYAAGPLDQKTYGRYVGDFNKIAANYQARQANIMEMIGGER